jgi:hypothetical protein
MKTSSHILQFVLAALVVMMLGGLAGWYLFVREHIDSTTATDAARGFGTETSFGNPLGSAYQNVGGASQSGGTTFAASGGARAPRLWRVTQNPVAGTGFAGTSTRMYFAEKATGNVFLADPSTSGITRLSNTLVQGVRAAHFTPDGNVLMQGVVDGVVTTYAASLKNASHATSSGAGVGELSGVYLPQDIGAVTLVGGVEPTELLYLVRAPQGGAVAVTSDFQGAEPTKRAELPLSGWDVQAPEEGTYVVTQLPTDDAIGYSYRIASDGALRPFVDGATGLIVTAGQDGAALYSVVEGASLALYVRTSADGEPQRLPIRTTADKCVWAPHTEDNVASMAYCAVPQVSPSSGYLDRRHQGVTHTSDAWWRIDADAGTATQFFTPSSDLSLDISEPVIDASGGVLLFINAADETPWMLSISEE